MPDTFVRTRCSSCGNVLRFDDFSAGGERCLTCARTSPRRVEMVRGPRIRRPNARTLEQQEELAYEQMLDTLPDELIDELVAALEAEASKLPPSPTASPVRGVLDELGIGRSALERQWAAWGFAAGFAANVAIAKYAQMATGAPMGQFIGPLIIGGVVAGLCCSAIGWGLAKLKEPHRATS